MTGAAASLHKPVIVPPKGSVTPEELAELIGAFNEVTRQLSRTHETLRAEVSRLEAELRQANDQLERSRRLAALGEMAAGIAHEVRNPLGSIRLYARMLEEDLADRPDERGVAVKIGAAVRSLDAVVVDVLNFARRMEVSARVADADETLTKALEECLAERAGGVRPRVVRRDRRRGEAVLLCDPGLAHRALVNVIRNAIEAMTRGGENESGSGVGGGDRGTLTLDAERRSVRGPGGASVPMTVVSVGDTGPGLSREVLERMFNPFFTTRETGTGLGLAIVHRIMDAHGGRVHARNGRGGGAVVELCFPLAQPLGPADRAGGGRGGVRIEESR